jgi:hypothetical protein
LKEKSSHFEQLQQKLEEMEIRHQSEMRFLQKEINRFKEDEQNRISFSNNLSASNADHLNTYSNRHTKNSDNILKSSQNSAIPISIKYNSQKHLVSHQKAMSISSNSLSGNVILSGCQSTK